MKKSLSIVRYWAAVHKGRAQPAVPPQPPLVHFQPAGCGPLIMTLSNRERTRSFSYKTHEASTFANIVVTVPGTVLGGQVKFSGFVGQNELSLDLKSNGFAVLEPNQSGSATNDSVIAGGTVLWALKNTYALATLVGTWGQTTLKDASTTVATLAHPTRLAATTIGTTSIRAGFIGTVTAGHVFDLAGPSGPKLDLRGSLGYTHNDGDSFKNVRGDEQNYTFSTWTGTGAATLFANVNLENNALLRPYIQGYVRQEWKYRTGFDFFETDGMFGTVRLDQDHFYGGVDAGLTYTEGNTTYGAAIYYEASGDERTLGGRLGMSDKLDETLKAAQPKGRFSWSGFYVGVNAGKAWGDAHASTAIVCLDDPAAPGCPFTSSQAASVSNSASGTMSDRGFTGGAQAGVNWQRAVSFSDWRSTSNHSGWPPLDPRTIRVLVTVATSFDTDWLLTARSRLGLVVAPSVLLYGTFGLAATELGVHNSVAPTAPAAAGQQGAASDRGRVMGWTVGGGAEWALNRNWSLNAEYLYLDFGKTTVNASVTDGMAPNANNMGTTVDLTAHIARAGINYKF